MNNNVLNKSTLRRSIRCARMYRQLYVCAAVGMSDCEYRTGFAARPIANRQKHP